VSSRKNNLNGNNNQNVTMFMEDTDEMAGMESSSYQPSTPSYPPPSYQQSTFSSYQPTPMAVPINPQQPPAYQGGMQTSAPQIQQIAPAATVNFQSDSQQQSNASLPMFNAISASSTAFPSPSTPSLPVNQLSTEVPVNLISDVNANPDKLTMIKSFSNESGMNNEWAKK